MKKSELRQIIKEELQNYISEKRTVWKSSEFEEMYNRVSDILDNLDYIENPRKEYILDALLELQGIIEKEGLMDID